MKKERCSWCGQSIQPGQGAKSNGKYYHNRCLITRNIAGKSHQTDYETEYLYEPVTKTLAIKQSIDELLTSTNFNWKEAAKESRMRILAKYGTGMNK